MNSAPHWPRRGEGQDARNKIPNPGEKCGLDPCYQALGGSDRERAACYKDFVVSEIPAGEWEFIREALQRGQLTGSSRFSDEVEGIIGRRVENRKQGRPRKNADK